MPTILPAKMARPEKRFRADRPEEPSRWHQRHERCDRGVQSIKAKAPRFISGDDRPGTHIAELDLWKAAAVDIDRDKGPWYRSIG